MLAAMSNSLYDQDFFAWADEQARLLRDRRFADADMAHIAEEIESMGRAEKRELVSRLTVQRDDLADHLADNPSLKPKLDELLVSGFRKAALTAAGETGLDRVVFPEVCAWSLEQIMNPAFWPDGAHPKGATPSVSHHVSPGHSARCDAKRRRTHRVWCRYNAAGRAGRD